MDQEREYFACLALKHTRGVGPLIWKQLFALFPSAYDAVRHASQWVSMGVEWRSDQGLKSMASSCRKESWRGKAEAEFKATRREGMEVVTWFDPRFPNRLKDLEDPPAMLYVQGDVSLFRNPGVAVVGARECTRLGLDAAELISAQLSQIGITVVSGLAMGIDRQAHLGGLRGIGGSIAVLGCGLDVPYPPGNIDVRKMLDQNGLVVTEHGPGDPPRPGHFPVRNRLISGLSLGVLVAEAANRSGSLITARLAGEQGRDVFALPGPLGQPSFTGCHKLIKQGAALVETAEDIVEILRYDFARELEDVPDPAPTADTECEFNGHSAEGKEAAPRSSLPATPVKTLDKMPELSENTHGAVENVAVGSSIEVDSTTVRKRPTAVEREHILLNDEEKEVMTVLEKADKVHIDVLGRELHWDAARISKILIILEMRGAVQQLPGMWYLAKEI